MCFFLLFPQKSFHIQQIYLVMILDYFICHRTVILDFFPSKISGLMRPVKTIKCTSHFQSIKTFIRYLKVSSEFHKIKIQTEYHYYLLIWYYYGILYIHFS